jgi:hypothetical protein
LRWLRSAVARALLFIAVALIISSVVATYYGAQLSTSYSTSVPSSKVGAVAIVVLPSSQGIAKVNVTGASQVLYLSLGVNPLSLLEELHGVGISIVSLSTHEDFRAGVLIEVAGMAGNPIFVEQAFQGVVKYSKPVNGLYTISSPVNSNSSLVVVAIPSDNSSAVNVGVSYRVTGYGRLSTLGALAAAAVLAVISVAYDWLSGRA